MITRLCKFAFVQWKSEIIDQKVETNSKTLYATLGCEKKKQNKENKCNQKLK